MDDEDSERVWHGNGSVDPVIDAQNVPVNNSSDITVTSQYTDKKFFYFKSSPISSTITKESTILEGSAASLSASVWSERQDIHNGESDFDELEHKALTRILDLRPSVS